MPAEQVGDKAGDGEGQGVFGAEQLHAHDGAGQRGVGRSGEDRDKAEGGEEVCRRGQQLPQHIAQGRADKEERGHFAALEASAEGEGGEEQLPPPAPGLRAAGLEGGHQRDRAGLGRAHAKAEIVAGAEQMDKGDEQQAAHDWPQIGAADKPLGGLADAVGQLGEEHAGQAEADSGHSDLHHQQPAHGRAGLHKYCRDHIMGVLAAPGQRGPVADNGGDQAGNDRVIAHPADSQHLHRKDCAGQRRAEDSGKARCDAGQEQAARVLPVQAEAAADQGGDGAAHLHSSALAARRAAEKVGDDRGRQDQRGHQAGHDHRAVVLLLLTVDSVHQQVVAAFRRMAEAGVEEGDEHACQRQQPEQPGLGEAEPRRLLQGPEKQGAGRADDSGGRPGQGQPFQHMRTQRNMLARIPAEGHLFSSAHKKNCVTTAAQRGTSFTTSCRSHQRSCRATGGCGELHRLHASMWTKV